MLIGAVSVGLVLCDFRRDNFISFQVLGASKEFWFDDTEIFIIHNLLYRYRPFLFLEEHLKLDIEDSILWVLWGAFGKEHWEPDFTSPMHGF
jgi:hypothetical protein